LENIKLIAGDFPAESTNEILIPDIYALLNQEMSSFQELVGETIILNVVDNEDNQLEKKYLIRGIYDSDYRQELQTEYFIYTGHNKKKAESVADETGYQFFKRTLTETPESE